MIKVTFASSGVDLAFPRQGVDADGGADHEAGQQTDAELPQVVAAGKPQLVPLGGGADRRQQRGGLLDRQADAGVPAGEGPRADGQHHPARAVPVQGAARGDGVDGVLQQLAHVHARARVQVAREQVDHVAQVHLEGRRPGRDGHRCRVLLAGALGTGPLDGGALGARVAVELGSVVSHRRRRGPRRDWLRAWRRWPGCQGRPGWSH